MVVYQDAGQQCREGFAVHGLQATFGMGVIQRPLRAGNAMQPVVFAPNVEARLIHVNVIDRQDKTL